MKTLKSALLASWIIGLTSGCSENLPVDKGANATGHTAPSASTVKANMAVLDKRPFANRNDFDYARRGLIAQDENYHTKNAEGETLFRAKDFNFIDKMATMRHLQLIQFYGVKQR